MSSNKKHYSKDFTLFFTAFSVFIALNLGSSIIELVKRHYALSTISEMMAVVLLCSIITPLINITSIKIYHKLDMQQQRTRKRAASGYDALLAAAGVTLTQKGDPALNMSIRSVHRQIGDEKLSSLVGSDKITFLIHGDSCAGMKRWLEGQTAKFLWVCVVNESQVDCIFLAFPLHGVSEEEVREANDAYMLFKNIWMSRDGVQWQDDHYVECTLKKYCNA